MKKKIISLICIAICALLVFNSSAFAAIFAFETQFEYSIPDEAWLTDLVIKEDMLSVGGIAQRTQLTALPDIPYTETPESFKKEVDEYCSLYTLKEGSERAGYIYLFDLLGSDESIFSVGATDQDVKDYLQGNGILYPASASNDELIMARALYVAMMTGAFSSVGSTGLEEALVSYAAQMSGIKKESLSDWLPESSILSLDEYILAASRLALWTSGYDVTVNTPDSEVYRLVAVMTIEKLGISVDKNLSFEDLKVIYTAALLGKKYGVVMNDQKLASALAEDNVAFYVLQLIGQQKGGLSLRADASDFSDAFYSVAENTDIFAIEPGEFYADIYKYETRLSQKCSSVWVYPTAYATGNSDASVSVSVNGKTIKNNFYTEVSLNSALDQQDLKIEVICIENGKKSTCTYTVTVYQGDVAADPEHPSAEATEGETFESSDSVVNKIFSSLGMNNSISGIIDDFYLAMPSSVKNVISFIAPTFGEDDSAAENSESTGKQYSDDYFADILDGIGAFVNADISGIAGVELAEKCVPDVFSFDYITFD